MKIYNQAKTEILENPNLELGHLEKDTFTTHVPYSPKIEGVLHYEVLTEYPNGGKDVKEVVDIEPQKETLEHDEVEDIFVYVPYMEEELNIIEIKKEIENMKMYLNNTDYMAIKCSELGLLMETEYPEEYAKRKDFRNKINELQEEYKITTN